MHRSAFVDPLPSFPDGPKQYRQWVLWKYKLNKDEKWTKVPYNLGGWKASHSDSRTWCHYEPVCLKWQRESDKYSGIGFVFTDEDPYTGIDLDKCLDDDGILKPWSDNLLFELDTYAEWSPSGKGVHIFAEAKLPPEGKKKPELGIEMYDQYRYFTVTGWHIEGTPLTIESRQEQVESVHKRIFGTPQQSSVSLPSFSALTLSEQAIIDKASRAKNGDKFRRLFFQGDKSGYGGRSWDDSAADVALCGILAFYCRGDAAMIDALFRKSKLYRNKWNERRGKRGTYGEMTIQAAIRKCDKFYAPIPGYR